MKNKKKIILAIIVIIILVIIGITSYNILTDENKLSASEKRWINNNINTVQNIKVINDVNIFGKNGTGVFYDFLNDFKNVYRLEINPVTYNLGEPTTGLSLSVKNTLNNDDYIFYTDHYVLVSKEKETITNYQDYQNKKIGIISDNLSYISSYLQMVNELNLIGYNNKTDLLSAFATNEEINYMLVPLTLYLDEIITNDYYIVNHLGDVKLYYTISSDNSNLAKILIKYYNNWYQDNLDLYFKKAEFNLFTTALNITDTEIDALQSISYEYGLVNNSPYEVLMSGNYGGITSIYLDNFAKFCNIDVNYTKYRNINTFNKALKNNKIDLYFDYYNIDNNYYSIDSNILLEYSIIAPLDKNLIVNSLNSLANQTIYIEESSILKPYLTNIPNLKIKTYKNVHDLKKLNKKDAIIVIDKNSYDLYSSKELNNYSERYHGTIPATYNFKSKNNSALYRLFTKYAMTLDAKEMITKGMYSYSLTQKTGSLLGTIAKYILITITVVFLIIIIFYKSSKRVKIAKKIKKENKIKFIDQLTSLKNRNYLNEYINNWNNNTVYPQTMIVIDLNNIQFINDTLGYEEGDKQIQAAANILIKTQLDNSDIMRTDGNEFLIYLVGYSQKQVTNYIHKLNKEFKKLPYEYGAEFGYSMITDNIKTIEDALVEATDEMKKSKKKTEGEPNE